VGGVEAAAPVMGRRRVAVKIDCDEVGIAKLQRSHRTPGDESNPNYRHRSASEAYQSPDGFSNGEPVAGFRMPPRAKNQKEERARHEGRPVLRSRKERERVENVRGGCDEVVSRRLLQCGRNLGGRMRRVDEWR